MASTYITRTPSSAGNRRKFTISMWVKRVKLGVDQWLVQAGASGSEFDIRFTTSDTLRFSTWDGSNGYGMITTRVFRDTSAWYHLVFQYDTAQATDTNRNKIYVNGEQISPSDTSAYNAGKHPPQNYDNPSWNNTTAFRINDVTWTSSSPKDAVYSHIHHTDGYAYDASTFGSTDSTTGEWKIKTSPSVTYGTNGFFILKDGNSVTDQSGNSNNFTVGGGTLTNTEDCPSNVFATLNPLIVFANTRYSNGNLTAGRNSGEPWGNALSTLAMRGSGKFYWENRLDSSTNGSGHNPLQVGIQSFNDGSDATFADLQIDGGLANSTFGASNYIWRNQGGAVTKFHNTTSTTWGVAVTPGNIIMTAFDVANGKIWWGRNGTWFSSGSYVGDPASGTYEAFSGISTTTDWFPVCAVEESYTSFNFGNGYFGTTQITSEGTNASGIGKFEYDVPTGYTALSTKGLNL